MQASDSEVDVSGLGVTLMNEPVSEIRKMVAQAAEMQTKVLLVYVCMRPLKSHPPTLIVYVMQKVKVHAEKNKQERSGIFEPAFPVVDLTKRKESGELKKLQLNSKVDDAVNQDMPQATETVSFSALASAFADFLPSCIELLSTLERLIYNMDRWKLSRQPKKVISLPLPASIPSNNTQATSKLIPDHQGQTNGSINREPAPGVKPSIEPVDVHDEPYVRLLIRITPTPVNSRGRGSRAVEAQVSYFSDSSLAPTSQNGAKKRKSCCSIM